jgi:hypothetical protein
MKKLLRFILEVLQILQEEKQSHKKDCNNQNDKNYNIKLYKMIRDNGGWENWRMIEIEKFPCNDKREAEYREEYYRKTLKAELNTQRCWRNIICIEPDCKSSAIIQLIIVLNTEVVKRCIDPDCKSSARRPSDYCKKHGGGKRCIEPDCKSSAQSPTDYCVKHGGGKRCIEPDCKSSAISPTDYCKKHGGGKRCIEPDCKSSAISPTDYCVKHGGGKICIHPGCKSSARSPTDYCKKHGEKYTCQCGSTLSVQSKKRHEKTKKHQQWEQKQK